MPKQIDDAAIGRLICELFESDAGTPLADHDDGYEHDTLTSIDFIAGDFSRLRILTANGREFHIAVIGS